MATPPSQCTNLLPLSGGSITLRTLFNMWYTSAGGCCCVTPLNHKAARRSKAVLTARLPGETVALVQGGLTTGRTNGAWKRRPAGSLVLVVLPGKTKTIVGTNVTAAHTYRTDNSNETTRLSEVRERLNGLAAGVLSERVSFDADSNSVTKITFVERAAKTLTIVALDSRSVLPATNVTNHSQPQSGRDELRVGGVTPTIQHEFHYDTPARLTNVADSERSGPSGLRASWWRINRAWFSQCRRSGRLFACVARDRFSASPMQFLGDARDQQQLR